MIRFEGIHKRYGARRILRGLDFRVEEGELLALLGPSGCGKTTTLKLVNRLIEPDGGRIFVRDRAVDQTDPIALRRSIGYVFQRFGLFPHLTVAANIAVVPRLMNWSEVDVERRVLELVELVGLESGLMQRSPASLSGGQQQRVGLARALAARPQIMLMDEPFGALDPVTRDTLSEQYRSLHRQLGLTTILVTHDMTEALLLADRVVVLDEGRVVQSGSPSALLNRPAAEIVTQLLRTPERQLRRLSHLQNEGTTTPLPGDD